MRKRIVGSILAAGLIISMLSGCGGTKEGKKQNIRVTYSLGEMSGGSSNDDIANVFAAFYKENPNVEITLESGGTALLAKIAANDAPDIVRIKSVWDLPTYVNRELCIPLDDYLKNSKLYDENDIFPLCKKVFTYDGKEFGKGHIYGLPKDWSGNGMWVNKKDFEAAGLEIPTMENPLTYSQAAEYAEKLKKIRPDGTVERYGMIMGSTSVYEWLETMLAAEGKSFWNSDYTKTTLTSADTKEKLKYIVDLQLSGATNSEKYPAKSNGQPEFADGEVSIFVSGFYAGRVFSNNTERKVELDDMIFCPPIQADGEKEVKIVGSPVGAVIMNGSENPDLAFKLWEFIHLGELSKARASKGFNLPIQKSFISDIKIEDPFQAKNFELASEVANCEQFSFHSSPYVAKSSVEAVFQKYLSPVLSGTDTLENAIKIMDEEILTLVKEGMEG